MALFEHIIMLRQDLSSSDLEEAIKVHEQTLGELDGNVVYKESWGLRSLAYPIKENKKAFYEFMNIELPQDKIDTLNSKLNLNDKIIRYLSIKVKDFCDTPTIMVKIRINIELWINFQKVQKWFLTIKMYQVLKGLFQKREKLHQEE